MNREDEVEHMRSIQLQTALLRSCRRDAAIRAARRMAWVERAGSAARLNRYNSSASTWVEDGLHRDMQSTYTFFCGHEVLGC